MDENEKKDIEMKRNDIESSLRKWIKKINAAIKTYNDTMAEPDLTDDRVQEANDKLSKFFGPCARGIEVLTQNFSAIYSQYDGRNGSYKKIHRVDDLAVALIQNFFGSIQQIDDRILDYESFITAFSDFVFSIWKPFAQISLELAPYSQFLIDQVNRITRPNYMIEIRKYKTYTRARAIMPTARYGDFMSKIVLFNTISQSNDSMDDDAGMMRQDIEDEIQRLMPAPNVDVQAVGELMAPIGDEVQEGGYIKIYAANKKKYRILSKTF